MSEKANVLFVDDEERIVNLMKVLFRDSYNVFTATSGAAALEVIAKQTIHVIVSDQRMPNMLGTELLARVNEMSPHTVRLLLTGYSDLAAIVGSINEGEVFRFVNKPWNNDELRAVVAEAAQVSSKTRAAGPANAAPATIKHAVDEPTGLLILDDNPRVREWFTEHFGDQYHVFNAGSVAGALDTLEKHDVGVIVTDQALGGESLVRLLRMLKQQYPMIMTVMLTSTQDSDFVISLINEVKVCRVVFKPVKHGALDLALKAAKRQHQASRTNPALLVREGVAAQAAEPDDPRLAQTLLEKMRNRFRWFSRASAVNQAAG